MGGSANQPNRTEPPEPPVARGEGFVGLLLLLMMMIMIMISSMLLLLLLLLPACFS